MSLCEALVPRGFDWMGVVKACRLGSDGYQMKLLGVEVGWAVRGIADVATHARRCRLSTGTGICTAPICHL